MASSRYSPLLSTLGIVALASTTAPVACNDDEGSPPPIDDVSDVFDVYEDYYAFYCECYADLDSEPVEECLPGYEIASDAEEMCLREIFDANPADFEILRCQAEALRGLFACQQAKGCPATFECEDGASIPEDYVCDGFPDCDDESDEQQSCPPQFMCPDGVAVPEYSICDGFPDCDDESDEQDCPAPFVCDDGSEVPADWVCDGVTQCEDESDEQQCPVTCESRNEMAYDACGELSDAVSDQMGGCFGFECGSGLEIPGEQVCNGTSECPDGEDEAFCEDHAGSSSDGG